MNNSFVITQYLCSDGILRSFSDPIAIRERIEALSHLKGNYPEIPMSDENITWLAFVAAAKDFAPHLDQWEKIKFETPYGPVYVTISRSDPYPDSFQEITDE